MSTSLGLHTSHLAPTSNSWQTLPGEATICGNRLSVAGLGKDAVWTPTWPDRWTFGNVSWPFAQSKAFCLRQAAFPFHAQGAMNSRRGYKLTVSAGKTSKLNTTFTFLFGQARAKSSYREPNHNLLRTLLNATMQSRFILYRVSRETSHVSCSHVVVVFMHKRDVSPLEQRQGSLVAARAHTHHSGRVQVCKACHMALPVIRSERRPVSAPSSPGLWTPTQIASTSTQNHLRLPGLRSAFDRLVICSRQTLQT